ncbi:MAG: hypothetical protein JOZ93_07205 [Sinobacteraceae bacterium]|nr:hypothetical protein [Nevskiaceae bacterium]
MRRFLIGLVLTLLLLTSTVIGIAVARWPAWKDCWLHLCRDHGALPSGALPSGALPRGEQPPGEQPPGAPPGGGKNPPRAAGAEV